MAKRIYFAAFIVDDEDYGVSTNTDEIVQYLSNVTTDEGLSNFMVWSRVEDLIADHFERGPLDIAYLNGDRGSAPASVSSDAVTNPVTQLSLNALQVAEDLIQEAITTHIYAEDDEIPDDCNYTNGLAQIRAAIAVARATAQITQAGAHALIAEALAFEADAFENDEDVNGGDLLEWFADWRQRAGEVQAQPDSTLVRIAARLRGEWHDPTGDLESDIAGVLRSADPRLLAPAGGSANPEDLASADDDGPCDGCDCGGYDCRNRSATT